MPVPVTVPLAPQSRTPAIITIPGTKPPASRRHACNPATSITAYVLPGGGDKSSTNALTTISVAIKRNNRLLGYQLKGHDASIVDLEFLQTPTGSSIHVLGSCDRDGVVFLWFLYVAIDALGIEKELCLLKKYSFFTLRKSTTAFYSRIRLAGSVEAGTMVLVPNDGANVRVVTFSCEATPPDTTPRPLLNAVPQEQAAPLPPPEHEETPSAKPLSTAALAGGAVAATAAGAAVVHETVVEDEEDELEEVDDIEGSDLVDPDDDLHGPEPPVDPALRTFSEATPREFERSMTSPLHPEQAVAEEEEEEEEEEVTGRMALNSTFPMSRAEGDQVDVEDDLATAAAMAAGLPVTEMEGALSDQHAVGVTHQRHVVLDGEEVEDLDDGDDDDEEFRDATGMVQELRLEDNERDYIEDDEVEDVDDDDVDNLDVDGEEFDDAIGHAHGAGVGLDSRGGVVVEGEGLGGR